MLRMCLHIVLPVILLLFGSGQTEARYIFRTFDVADGLAENTVKCIAQDEQGFIWLGTQNGLCRFDGKGFDTFRHDSEEQTSIGYNNVQALLPLEDGLWVGTERGVDFFSIQENRFYHALQVTADGKQMPLELFVKNMVAVGGKVFVQGRNGQLFIRKAGMLFERCDYDGLYWYSICPYKDSLLLAHTYNGLYLIDTEKNSIAGRLEQPAPAPSETIFYSARCNLIYVGYGMQRPTEAYRITADLRMEKLASDMARQLPGDVDKIIDYQGKTLFGTNGKGLIEYGDDGPSSYTTTNSTISSNVVSSLFVDRNENLWVGTYRYGINFYSRPFGWFRSLTVANNQLTHKLVTAVAARDSVIFVGLDGGGLNVYDQQSGTVVSYTRENSSLPANNILSLVDDGEYIWLGIYQEGLCRFSPADRTFRTFPLRNNYIWNIKDDGKGNIWVTGRGVYLFDKKTGAYTLVDGLDNCWAADVAFDRDAAWIGTTGAGIYKLDRKKRTVVKHYSKDSRDYPLPDDAVAYLTVDSKHQVWFSAHNTGLFRLEDSTGYIVAYGEEHGLISPNIYALEEDMDGHLWLGTDNGLFRFNVQTSSFTVFGRNDNLPSTQFNHSASFRRGDMLYFGTTNGVVCFNSKDIEYDEEPAPVYFRHIRLLSNNRSIHINEAGNADAIVLPYNHNFFTIRLSVPEFTSPDKLFLSCRMENFENSWREIKNDREVTYTNIPPGEYLFCVRTLDHDGQWSDELSRLPICITPPWWRTGWATCLWIMLASAVVFLIYRIYLYQQNIKRQAEAKEEEKNRVKKDNEMKLRFFTNISHEFRTPLSLILSPLEILIKNEPEGRLRNQLARIYRNAANLLNLVNQLLDFRKLETTGEKLSLTFGDLVEFVDNIFRAFQEKAVGEEKELTLTVKFAPIYMPFDKDKVRKIINNLLSNAFKNTDKGSQIAITLDRITVEGLQYALIRIADTGCGIPVDKLPHIFECFYQVEDAGSNNTGSGIGLHIVKEYVGLHQGTVTVESTLHKGSVFTVCLPFEQDEPVQEEAAPVTELPITAPEENSERKTLLVVEDNTEFRQFLVEQLTTDFRVVQAADGEEGEQVALNELPDLIITDIMMPKVDGVELCKRIKTNVKVSHIPVILLTARASNEFMLTGYEAGADEYISKPFNFDILLLKIRKLIRQQEERKAQFRNSIEISPTDLTITSLDEKLLQAALRSIEENISNTEYSIDDLSNDVGLGRTNLYKKIQSVTGKTPASFIRSVRLKRAAQLLHASDLTVSEIADRTGFGNIKYFNQHFKEEFGMTPTQYKAGKSH